MLRLLPRATPSMKAAGRRPARRNGGRILFRIAAKLREEAPLLAEMESRNSGKPIVEAEYDIADAATCFEYYGAWPIRCRG